MVDMVHVNLMLEGDVTWTKYLAMREQLPTICETLGLEGTFSSNMTIPEE